MLLNLFIVGWLQPWTRTDTSGCASTFDLARWGHR